MASFYNNYYRYYRPYSPNRFHPFPIEDKSTNDENSNSQKKSSRYDSSDPIFQILGISLYLDDIIILGLLFFLYQEGVQDEMLYISLILLLLS